MTKDELVARYVVCRLTAGAYPQLVKDLCGQHTGDIDLHCVDCANMWAWLGGFRPAGEVHRYDF